ncbi:GGDEF domain-containing protein [Shinella curvata]|uniref:diguanylate cyclase n=1 Tax=Shinella curvata TaxID=1817964 RepID=A0ABT8XFN9_9HYPH|nr:GGDEF domain-containing protein [Shinella curvata]MCJ8053241.1 GGDEF domain-containing protein [Shinella curvata]MDO6122572.1 GGDEF domain-containing protein [Shinella curvata]
MRLSEGHGWLEESGMARIDTILPLALLRDRATTDLILSGLDASGVAFALFSPEDELAYGSCAFRLLFDVQPNASTFTDIMRNCHDKRVGPKIGTPVEAFLDMACRKRRSSPQRTFEIDINDGRWFLVNETLLPGGWLWHVFTDITMLKSNERVLQLARDAAQLAADTDPLTGLFNRRAAMERLETDMQAALRDGTPLSLVLIDLDNFKSINDRYGHANGDRVLKHFAAAGRQELRGGDFFARIGGEEFLVLMPGTGLRQATDAIERLRSHMARAENRADLCCSYTMSAGIAEFCGTVAEDLFERADRALYRAKHLGRDRITCAE